MPQNRSNCEEKKCCWPKQYFVGEYSAFRGVWKNHHFSSPKHEFYHIPTKGKSFCKKSISQEPWRQHKKKISSITRRKKNRSPCKPERTPKSTKHYPHSKLLLSFLLVRATIPGRWKQFPVGCEPAIEIILFHGTFFPTEKYCNPATTNICRKQKFQPSII